MGAVTFDTLKFASTLKEAGVPAHQAEAEARAIVAAIGEVDVATKRDLVELELRMTIKVGVMLVAAVGVLVAVIKNVV